MSVTPLRILILSGFFAPDLIGGAEVSARNIAAELATRGHTVMALRSASGASNSDPFRLEPGIEVRTIPSWRPYSLRSRGTGIRRLFWHAFDHFDVTTFFSVRRMIDRFKPDVALVHTTQGLGPLALLALKLDRIPTVQFLHDYGVVCVNRGMFRADKRCVKQCHLCTTSMKWQQMCSPAHTTYVSPSQYVLDVANFYTRSSRRGEVIPNPNEYTPAPKLEQVGGLPRLIYVGRLEVEKGIPQLLAAAVEARRGGAFELRFVGAGALAEQVAEFCRHNSWATFDGFLKEAEVMERIADSDGLLCPSVWPENYPGVVVQSLVSGIPVLGSRRGGIPELVGDYENGLLFDPETSELVTAIATFVGQSHLRQKLRQGALAWGAAYNPVSSHDRIEALLQRICRDNGHGRSRDRYPAGQIMI